ncbi:uncharacterized protein LOC117180669 [Belonocnema kinseyi]|uniref:uncharacterized protein LOC117180669 n=1 Tax=Belonocnema kinseyi TaxID=2817044 RepID=UPI00143D0D4B|nr:uncharacterized protein LOC117180669 [Belonocnema kinseyi]
MLKGRSRPKCLVLQFSDRQTSLDSMKKKLLQNAWENQFLELSILEIVGNSSKVQYYNPFTNIYLSKMCLSKVGLFPDKLRNMNHYQLTVSVLHYPPNVYIEYDESGCPVNFSGSDVLLLNALAMKMNFNVKFEVGVNVKTKAVFFMEQLHLNKHQVFLTRTMVQNVGYATSLENWVTGLGSFHAVSLKMENQLDFVELNVIHALSQIVVFSVILCLLIYVLKQYSNDWNLSFTAQVILGFTVPHVPVDWKGRIIFAYIVIVSFVYSSAIYAMLTDINSQPAPVLQLATLTELDKSGLRLEVDPTLINWMSKDVQNLDMVKKCQTLFTSTEDCVLHAIAEKNVSCVMLKTQAKWFHLRFKGADETTLMATVEEPLVTSVEGFYLEPGSPYVTRFRSLLLRLMAFGLFEKWNTDVVPRMPLIERNKEVLDILSSNHNQLFRILVTEILVGFLVSAIVFVVEIVVAKINKRRL